jgi:ribosomal-protein-alanine N-acetyltransferase
MKKLFDEMPRIQGPRIALCPIDEADVDALQELVSSQNVYRYLPTFLFEKQFDDMRDVVRNIYGDLFTNKESLILGIRVNGEASLCGLAEFYGLRDDVHKISIGYRLLERYWGQGIATQAVSLMVYYLYNQTDIQVITASTMIENIASERVLEKNGFLRTARSVEEDWGFETPTIANKWFC